MNQPDDQLPTAALMERINRELAREGHQLRANLSKRDAEELGAFYVIDLETLEIIATHVHLQALANSIEVLNPDEPADD
jgi:hypothetical protein